MNHPIQFHIAEPRRRLSQRTFDLLAIALALGAYTGVFLVMGWGPALSLKASFVSVAPLVIVCAVARVILARHLVRSSINRQVVGHVVLALLFTFGWYWLLMLSIAVSGSASPVEFTVRQFFHLPAMQWQLLQGITVYALVASLTYHHEQARRAETLADRLRLRDAEQNLSRYFVRQGENLHPVDVSEIVSITGADDYTEVATLAERHLVSMRLADFEKSLGSGNFIRVHRSHIVNVDWITRAEPAGRGRILLCMETGERITTSRDGAKRLRERVI